MIDFHSHILPGMDDGSRNVEESIALLEAAHSQGVEAIFATPHFYAKNDSPERFFARRKRSLERLRASDAEVLKKIDLFCGAEVAYFYGMTAYEGLPEFGLGGSDFILIEMPFDKWQRNEVDEVLSLREKCGLVPILAHVERFLGFGNKKYIYEMAGKVLMQSNAEFFIDKRTKRKAVSLLKKGIVDVLGSDCHNTESRPENIGEAFVFVENLRRGRLSDRIYENEKTIMNLISDRAAKKN